MERLRYSVEKSTYEIKFKCNDENIIEEVRRYIEMRIKAESFDAINSIPVPTITI